MRKEIVSWLQDGGTYATGLELFDALARPADSDRCRSYLHGGTDPVRRAMLEGELRRILRGLRDEPQLYATQNPTPVTQHATRNTQNATPNTQHPTPEAGIHIATYADLPPEQRAWYDRLREIAPLIGSLHADLSRTEADDAARRQTATELCRLDDERRRLWQQLDAWAEGQKQEQKQEPDTQHPTPVTQNPSPNTAEEQLQLLRRRKRLQDNILTARRTVERWQGKEGGEGYTARATARLESYRTELEQVQSRLRDIEGGQA